MCNDGPVCQCFVQRQMVVVIVGKCAMLRRYMLSENVKSSPTGAGYIESSPTPSQRGKEGMC